MPSIVIIVLDHVSHFFEPHIGVSLMEYAENNRTSIVHLCLWT